MKRLMVFLTVVGVVTASFAIAPPTVSADHGEGVKWCGFRSGDGVEGGENGEGCENVTTEAPACTASNISTVITSPTGELWTCTSTPWGPRWVREGGPFPHCGYWERGMLYHRLTSPGAGWWKCTLRPDGTTGWEPYP